MNSTIFMTLLCLSERGTSTEAASLDLLAATAAKGLSITIATHPVELIHAKGSDRPINILVIDCIESTAFDIPHLISVIRADRQTGILVWVESHLQRMKALAAGADLAIRLPLDLERFLIEVREIAGYYLRAPTLRQGSLGPTDGDAAGRNSSESSPSELNNVTFISPTRSSPILHPNEKILELAPLPGDSSGTSHQVDVGGKKFANDELSPWRLLWNKRILQTPDGHPVPLTKLEHLFVTTIFSTADSRVTYELWNEIAMPRSPDVSRHLAVLVCHVRAKCLHAGTAMPIRVERGGGYRFVGACAIQKGVHSAARPRRARAA